jgi:CelD/BcsL family acetyltransferase involved in cellulose biosynthesis
MHAIQEIKTASEFETLKDEWTTLLAQSRARNIFLTWQWLFTWWLSWGNKRDRSLRILLLRRDGALEGIAPLYVERSGYAKTLRFLGDAEADSDYLDFILRIGTENEWLPRVFERLESDGDWDMMDISGIPETSITVEFLKKKTSLRFMEIRKFVCPRLKLGQSWDEFIGTIDKGLRHDVKRRRKIEADLWAGFYEITDRGALPGAMEELFELNKRRFAEKEKPSPFLSPDFEAFHRKAMPALFEAGMLRLLFMSISGAVAACLYAFKYGDSYYYYQSGFNPEWRKLSPGSLMIGFAIERAMAEGAANFDFLRGDEPYKHRWTKDATQNLDLALFRRSARGMALHLLYALRIKAWKRLRRLVKRLIKGGGSA